MLIPILKERIWMLEPKIIYCGVLPMIFILVTVIFITPLKQGLIVKETDNHGEPVIKAFVRHPLHLFAEKDNIVTFLSQYCPQNIFIQSIFIRKLYINSI